MSDVFGALELGGTKAVVAVGRIVAGQAVIEEEWRYPTTSPEQTLAQSAAWWRERGGVTSVGIGSFGPIRVDRRAPDFSSFLLTPKLGWEGFSLGDFFAQHLPQTRLSLDTDVNAALLGEMRQGAAQGLRDAVYLNSVYLTIGTGIGAGICAEGNLVHGTLHPEIGHLRVPRHPDDNFAGVCPFHGDCWEGLASGPAIDKRWGSPAHLLAPEHPAWEMQAWYLAQGILAACAILSPAMIILGGGVSQATGLHEKVARHLDALSAGYFENLGSRLTAPQLGQQAGIIGAMLLNEI